MSGLLPSAISFYLHIASFLINVLVLGFNGLTFCYVYDLAGLMGRCLISLGIRKVFPVDKEILCSVKF